MRLTSEDASRVGVGARGRGSLYASRVDSGVRTSHSKFGVGGREWWGCDQVTPAAGGQLRLAQALALDSGFCARTQFIQFLFPCVLPMPRTPMLVSLTFLCSFQAGSLGHGSTNESGWKTRVGKRSVRNVAPRSWSSLILDFVLFTS